MSKPNSYTILGAARSGLASARMLRAEGCSVFVSDAGREDQATQAIDTLRQIGAEFEFGGHTARALDADVLLLSPGVPDTIPIVRDAVAKGIKITNEIEIASQRCAASIVAITGTNGKTTTTELVGFLLRRADRNAFVAGNIGIPFSQVAPLAGEHDVVVLETSSFQLEHIETFHPHVAVILNVTPDHLDRYNSFDAYRAAKLRITMNQQSGDVLIYNADDPKLTDIPEITRATPLGISIHNELPIGAFLRDGMMVLRIATGDSEVRVTEEIVMHTDEIRIRGPHNLYNSMAAALSARSLGVGVDAIRDGLAEFAGVPHRLEPVGQVDGVRYVNDSKATNVDSLWYALSSFSEPIILIAGGRSKKNVYDSILPLLERNVKGAVLIGEAADEMETAFARHTHTWRAGNSMENAVDIARSHALAGNVVLLSPACASFDMFRDYEQRGEVFRQIVERLVPRAEAWSAQ